MTTKPEVEPEEEPVEPEEEPDEDNWGKMRSMIGDVFDERMDAWQAKQPKKTTSTRSPQKQAAPKRKQGFLSGGFFSSLTPPEE